MSTADEKEQAATKGNEAFPDGKVQVDATEVGGEHRSTNQAPTDDYDHRPAQTQSAGTVTTPASTPQPPQPATESGPESVGT